jgi:hypothetical protein
MSTKLTPVSILDNVLAKIQDNSDEIRVKMLGWLNNVIQRLSLEPWDCLKKTSTSLTITGNAITLPSDFGSIMSVYQTDNFCLTKDNQLSAEEIYAIGTGVDIPLGFVISNSTLTFYPEATGTCIVDYLLEVPSCIDDSTQLVFPVQFRPLIERACLTHYYEFDADDRINVSASIETAEFGRLKEWNYKTEALPRFNNRGYIRTR